MNWDETVEITIIASKRNLKKVTFIVAKEFINLVPNYKNMHAAELIDKYCIFKYFHNENGPAAYNETHKHYFIKGKLQE